MKSKKERAFIEAFKKNNIILGNNKSAYDYVDDNNIPHSLSSDIVVTHKPRIRKRGSYQTIDYADTSLMRKYVKRTSKRTVRRRSMRKKLSNVVETHNNPEKTY